MVRVYNKGVAPAGADGVFAKQGMAPPAGDASTHTGPFTNDVSAEPEQRLWTDLEQPPIGPVLVDARHNLYMKSRYGMRWEGGLWPVQILPDWSIVSSNFAMERFHAPLTESQARDRASRPEKGKGSQFPTAVVNPAQYMRMAFGAPIGIGPVQIQEFHASTDASSRASSGIGPPATWPAPTFMSGGFAAET